MFRSKIFFIILGVIAIVSGMLFFILNKYEHIAEQAQIQQNSSAFILSANQPDYFPLRDFNIAPPRINSKAAVLFDTHSGRFLYRENIYKLLPIASLTKLMTAVIVIENLDLNSDIKISVEDLNVDGNGADLFRGEKIQGNNLLKIMLIKSSNDAALVFAREAQTRGVDLVEKMNEKAMELGMNSTRFTNPAGLDDNALSTAFDLVKLVEYIGDRHKPIWEVLKIKALDVSSSDGTIVHHVINTDQLLGKLPNIIGGKTGFTPIAMGTMILVTDVDDGFSNLIAVILGSNDRFSDVKQLIEWGQTAYRWK